MAGTLRAWRNTVIRFGLVSVPVSLAPAKRDAPTLTRHHYDPKTKTRARQGYTVDGLTVLSETALLYDVDGEAVAIDAPKLDAPKGITLAAWLSEGALDPLLYDAAYVVWAKDENREALATLVGLLRDSPYMMLAGEAVFTDRPRSIVLRWSEASGALILHTLSFTSRVDFAAMGSVAYGETSKAAKAQALALVEALADSFVPADVDPLEAATLAALKKAAPKKAAMLAPISTAGNILATLRADVEERSKATKRARSKGATKG